ncbi:RNA polymerase sigma factor [Singulisphaera sp. PoT]|uniref:RNA polymerase sigma factor n=1 Tax=Singulisphaera sp. PoT TaxID=3411797 RepID=UPI003BF50221
MDLELLGQLLDRHAAALELYARQWCVAPEDVVQEAFLKLAGQRVAPDEPLAWLFRVVRNGAISAARSSRRRIQHEAQAAAGARAWFEPPGDGPSKLNALDPEAAASALLGLPIEQREVIVAHLWGGLTFQQVGEVVGSSSSSAHRLYASGLAALRERLGVPCPKTRSTRN